MTRHNLAQHLSWLFNNISLSTPAAAYDLPTLTRPHPSHSEIPDSLKNSTLGSQASGQQEFLKTSQKPSTSANPVVNGLPERTGQAPPARELAQPHQDNMGRLKSATKPRKPSLVFQQAEHATPTPPSPNSANNHVRSSASKRGPPSSLPKDTPARHENAALHAAKHQPTSSFGLNLTDFDAYDVDRMDLTTDTLQSNESLEFVKQVSLQSSEEKTEASSQPKSDKKRKSSDISGLEADFDEYTDVYNLLGTDPPMSTPARKSTIRKPGSSSIKPQRRSKTECASTPIRKSRLCSIASIPRDFSSPSQAVAFQRAALQSDKAVVQKASSPTRIDPVLQERRNGQPEAATALTSESGLFVVDSDDEFANPLSPEIGKISQNNRQTQVLPSPANRIIETLPQPPPPPSGSFNSRESHTPTLPPLDNMVSSQAPRILSHLSQNQIILTKKSQQLDALLQQNAREFQRAIIDRCTKEQREAIKMEKERLVQQQRCLETLKQSLREYVSLCDEREALATQVAQAYSKGNETEQDEIKLDELTEAVEKKEEQLMQELSGAGVDEADCLSLGAASPCPPQADKLVLGTQHIAISTASVDMSHPSADPLPAGIESATQAIHQTQIEPSRLYPRLGATGGGNGNSATGSVASRTSDSPFQRACHNQTLPSSGATTRPRPIVVQDDDSFEDGDMFEFDDHVSLPTLSRSAAKKPAKVMQSPGEEFSDFSDDTCMLALAQDCESQQSRKEEVSRGRRILSETSGNAVVVVAKTRPPTPQIAPPPPKSQPELSIPPRLMKFSWSPEVQRVLKDRFRMKGFRQNQLEAINSTLAGKDAFVLMPTGGGKSLCYQLPAVVKSGKTCGVTIVISPLLSLMQDQVTHMKKLGIQAVAFNGECSPQYRQEVLTAFDGRNPEHFIQLLYVTPEMVGKSTNFTSGLQKLYRNGKLARIVIDEAHCVSQWGHDFRPDYKNLGQERKKYPNVPVMALTATATQNVIVDIKHNLGMNNCQIFSQSFNRPNLYYEVRPKGSSAACIETIVDLVQKQYPGKTGIIYTISRKQAEDVAEKLSNSKIAARHYHAGMESPDKVQVQNEWQSGAVKVVVATIAFGMGIDKPDVRFVIHHGLPKSLEGYYQETGRAGRDGNPSDCILLYGRRDIGVHKNMIMKSGGSTQQQERQLVMLNRVTAFCENESDCRRTEVLRYFGEEFSRAQCHKACDNCRSGVVFEKHDFSDCAKCVLRIVGRQGALTGSQCADILLRKKYPQHMDRLSDDVHGDTAGLMKHQVVRVIDRLLAEKALVEDNKVTDHGMAIEFVMIGPMASQFLNGRRKLMIPVPVSGTVTTKPPAKKRKAAAASKAKKSKGQESAHVQSTYVSSPVGRRRRVPRAVAQDSDDEHGPTTRHGYATDGFVVSDGEEDEDEDEEEAISALPSHRPAKPSTKKKTKKKQPAAAKAKPFGPPIPCKRSLRDLSEFHQDFVDGFVKEARKIEENIRNKKELRRPLFSDKDLREMAINWTVTLERMGRIPNIDADKVREFGPKLLPLLRQKYQLYMESTAGQEEGEEEEGEEEEHGDDDDDDDDDDDEEDAAAAALGGQDTIDLISSDIESWPDGEEGGGGGAEEDDELDAGTGGSTSHYFASSSAAGPSERQQQQQQQGRIQASADAFNARLEQAGGGGCGGGSSLNFEAKTRGAAGGGARGRGGRKHGARYGRGGYNGGVRKRNASGGSGSGIGSYGRRASGSGGNGEGSRASSYKSGGPKRNNKIVRKAGGVIGLMPM